MNKRLSPEQHQRVAALNLMGFWFAGYLSRQSQRLFKEIANDR